MPILVALLPSLVSTLIPVLLGAFAKANPTAAAGESHTWVLGLFQDAGKALSPHVPAWLTGELGPIETALATMAEAELAKILPNS